MNRSKTAISINVLIWVTIFLSPILVLGLDQSLSWPRVLRGIGMPLVLLVVYYMNYLWLIPKYFLRGKRRFFGLINIALVISLAIIVHLWFQWFSARMNLSSQEDNGLAMQIFHILYYMFCLGVTITIATSIRMSIQWAKSEKEREEALNALREAELENLRYQINPHFMLNTLNNIYALTAFDQQKAQTAIMELSKMMRHILYDNKEPPISLRNELEFIDNYINLMKLRLSSDVEIVKQFNVPKNCQATVAPLIFISLIENAFKHGISPTNKSFIHINIQATNEKIVCEIKNSNYPKTDNDHSGHGIGLKQVQRRLDLSYPGRYSWEKEIDEETNIYKSKITLYDTQLHHH